MKLQLYHHHIHYYSRTSRPILQSVLWSLLLSWVFLITCKWCPLILSMIVLDQPITTTTILLLPPVAATSSRQKLYRENDEKRKRNKKGSHKNDKERNNRFASNRFFGSDESSSFDKSLNGTEFLKSIFRDANAKKPRHIIQGLWYGIKSALTGSIMAIGSIIAIPVLGYQKNEWIGLGLGILSGALYALIFALIGYGQGIYKVYEGLIATPAAIYAAHVGQIWRDQTQRYDYYYLDQEASELQSSTYGNGDNSQRNVADKTYYNLLQISTNASSKEIKRAYYRQARDIHPDKNPSEEAAELFRQLHLAYITLYDDEKRAKYDKFGVMGAAEWTNLSSPFQFDPHVFYAILFNSQLVEPYIGELTIASFTDDIIHLVNYNGNKQQSPEEILKILWNLYNDNDQKDRKSLKRLVDIALFLRSQVEPYVTGSMSEMEFRGKCRQEAIQISEGNQLFGYQFLYTIGTALTLEARQFLSIQNLYSIPGFARSVISSIRKFRQRSQRIVASTKKTFKVLRLIVDSYEENMSNNINDETVFLQEHQLKKLLPALLDMGWSYNTHDISFTLRGACRKVFIDHSNTKSKYKRMLRAEAIQILGEEFLAQASLFSSNNKQKSSSNVGDFYEDDDDSFERLEVAFQISQMKASGQDTPHDAEKLIENKKKQRIGKKKPRVRTYR